VKRPVTVSVLAAALLACVFAACGGSDESSPADVGQQRISDQELQVLLQSANDFTREIIEDGLVTAEEYERAVFRTIQCMDEAGVEHTEPVFTEYRFDTRWEYSVVGGIGSATNDLYTQCHEDYERDVALVWSAQEAMTESEQQMVDEEYLACVKETGIDVATLDELSALQAAGTLTEADRAENARCLILAHMGVDLNDLE
jgi:hypothetical protein